MPKEEETWMDGKKIREAIEAFQGQVNWLKRIDDKECEEACRCCIEYFETAIEALEKQLPKKPIIKSEKEVPHTHNLGRLLRFHCPNCGRFIVGMYEKDVERGGGISNSLKGCSTCLQAIDFSEYYSKRNVDSDKSNEELQWDD